MVKETIIVNNLSIQTIILMKGIPGSGKSTWAKEYISSRDETYARIARVNKDEFRLMIVAPEDFNKEHEKVVLSLERVAGLDILNKGWDLIVDDTNISSKHFNFWKQEAEKRKINMIEVFMDVELDECIARDAKRVAPVGEKVIKEMYRQLKGEGYTKTDPRVIDPYTVLDLPKAIICDLDGTIALMNGRKPFDDKSVGTDLPNQPVVNIIETYWKMGYTIIFLSGRTGTEVCKDQTIEWLKKNVNITNYLLHFRAEGDSRRDSLVKKDLFNEQVEGKYHVEFVLDDRNQVVDLWRKEFNLPCFQVYYGNF